MYQTLLLLFFLFNSSPESNTSINPVDLKFNGLAFNSGKKWIWKKLGKVEEMRVYYECGFFSEDEQGKAFFELRYPDAIWIGNDTEGYSLDKLFFDTEGKTTLTYKDWAFSGKTSQKELEELFSKEATPVRISETKELEWIGLPFEDRDDGCHFYFEGGKLKEFEYWTPC